MPTRLGAAASTALEGASARVADSGTGGHVTAPGAVLGAQAERRDATRHASEAVSDAVRRGAKAGPAGPAHQGLVTCAISRRGFEVDPELAVAGLVAGLWSPAFPRADLVGAAAGLFTPAPAWDGREGPRPRIVIGPGCIALEAHDPARAERTAERVVRAEDLVVHHAGLRMADGESAEFAWQELIVDRATGEIRAPTRRDVITGWSQRSRNRMFKTLNQLDYAPMFADPMRMPAMVTLTYPGDWLTVAPNGDAAKTHLDHLRKRYQRAWGRWVPCMQQGEKGHKRCKAGSQHHEGEELVCIWKQEFQRRGAPHFHLLMTPPHGEARYCKPTGHDDGPCGNCAIGAGLPFREWLSTVWADIVDHPDPEERRKHLLAGTGVDYSEGLKCRDPRRVATYFLKHGAFKAKDYQHCVPEAWQAPGQGPGRFWGYWGLEKALGVQEIDQDDYTRLARLLRRYSTSQGVTREVTVPRKRVDRVTGEVTVRMRKVRRPVRRFYGGCRSGWLSVNDGPALASALARALDEGGWT